MMKWWPGDHNVRRQTTQKAGSVMSSRLMLPIAELEDQRVPHVIAWPPMPLPGDLVHLARMVYAGVPLEPQVEAPCGSFIVQTLTAEFAAITGGVMADGGWRMADQVSSDLLSPCHSLIIKCQGGGAGLLMW